MNLLDLVETQLISNRLPLVAVTLAAVPHANTPVVLTMHWHGFVEVKLTEDSETVGYQSVPSSALQVNSRWDKFEELENDMLETAWELGAWNVERTEAKPFERLGADALEATCGMHAFGSSTVILDGDSPFVSDVPDRKELVETAAHAGYIHWLFRPVRGGLFSEIADDVTLQPGGYRNPPCPLLPRPVTRPMHLRKSRKVLYSFGRASRLAM
jgi:hypothetical protein